MDNVYLQTELKIVGDDANIAQAQFKFGMVLAGLGIIHQHQQDEKHKPAEDEQDQEDAFENDLPRKVAYFTKAVAPVLIPTIRSLSEIRPDEPKVVDDASDAA
jgi:hypothetical protein